jgi:hypothetical protein
MDSEILNEKQKLHCRKDCFGLRFLKSVIDGVSSSLSRTYWLMRISNKLDVAYVRHTSINSVQELDVTSGFKERRIEKR